MLHLIDRMLVSGLQWGGRSGSVKRVHEKGREGGGGEVDVVTLEGIGKSLLPDW